MKLASRSNRIGLSTDDYDSTTRDSPPPPPSRQVMSVTKVVVYDMRCLCRDLPQGLQYTELQTDN